MVHRVATSRASVGGAELGLSILGPVIRGLLMGSSTLVTENYTEVVRATGT